eukprot:1068776-Pleurochrysis_carterae.AAC.1
MSVDDYDGFGPERSDSGSDVDSGMIGVRHVDEEGSVHSDGEDDWECDDGGAAEEELAQDCAAQSEAYKPSRPSTSKLWGTVPFPSGVKGLRTLLMDNVIAAQTNWECPCLDRRNCLSKERIETGLLYDHRKRFQESAPRTGGKRDVMRTTLQQHYSSESRSFSRSFVVGTKNDCCAAAYGLAC